MDVRSDIEHPSSYVRIAGPRGHMRCHCQLNAIAYVCYGESPVALAPCACFASQTIRFSALWRLCACLSSADASVVSAFSRSVHRFSSQRRRSVLGSLDRARR